jgi:hypothetical protein
VGNFVWGAVAAIAISAAGEVTVPAEAFAAIAGRLSVFAAAALPSTSAPNVASSGASTFQQPYTVPGGDVHPADAMHPAFKQVRGLQQIDRMASMVLGMAIGAPQVYADTAVSAERLIGELRVKQAGGEREANDANVASIAAQLRQLGADATPMDQQLADAQAKLDVVRDMAGRDLPSEPRVEYDLWMVWVASLTDTSGRGPAHSLNNSKIEQHFMDIKFDDEMGLGGRLGQIAFLDPRGWHWDTDTKWRAQQRAGSRGDLGDRWNRYLLVDKPGS